MKKVRLLIDIGNTNTSIAVAKGRNILKRYFIHTIKEEVKPSSFKRLLRGYIKDIDEVVIVSVVPKFLSLIKKGLRTVLRHAPLRVVGKNIKVPMRINY